jgi:CrcB protein
MQGRLILSALEPIDSDVDLGDGAQRSELRRKHGAVLLVIAAGGVLGALLRYQLDRWWPTPSPDFPWTTLLINITGCLVIGSFLAMITERWSPHPMLRPFFGTGVLGGYTTFSTYAVDIVLLIRAGHPGTAVAYLVGTLAGSLVAVTVGMVVARRLLVRRGPR